MPSIGEKVPNFERPANGGNNIALSDYAGKYVVLYFYPRDNTPGCTTQSKEFSAALPTLSALNTVVLGVSADSVASHDKFVDKQGLEIPLLSDEDNQLCDAFGVWTEKNMYGKKFMGIVRSTFLINPDGVLVHEWRKVKVAGHVDAVVAHLQGLSK
jgi:peroxiredoxin Q/BCP